MQPHAYSPYFELNSWIFPKTVQEIECSGMSVKDKNSLHAKLELVCLQVALGILLTVTGIVTAKLMSNRAYEVLSKSHRIHIRCAAALVGITIVGLGGYAFAIAYNDFRNVRLKTISKSN